MPGSLSHSRRHIISGAGGWILAVTLFVLFAQFGSARAASPTPEADRAWQTILEQAGGPGSHFKSQEEALDAAQHHLDAQESALRDFLKFFPADPRHYSAGIRLAAILAARSRLLKQPALRADANKLLSDLESDPATPPPVKADAGFARVSQVMEDAANGSAGSDDDAARETLLKTVRTFDAAYPDDRRTAGLLTELATSYDADPVRKKALLHEAELRAPDPQLRERITDDLHRLDLLGRPSTFRLQPWQGGAPIDLAALRGKVVVILFWASWSLPSLHELADLEATAREFAGEPVEFLTVSLDDDRKALAATIDVAKLTWPVHCDGRGWKGELVRSLGINALPTVWVLDRKGQLLALNARGPQTEELVRQALNAPF